MSDPLRPLRVNALELLRQPGSQRDLDVTVGAEALGVRHASLAGDPHVTYRLESLDDAIRVSGVLEVRWTGVCRRCLTELSGAARVVVDERYQTELSDPDAFPIEHGQLDLAPMTRELALLALDDERLCRADCAGLCPVCGVDKNTVRCTCDPTVRDDRWAVLDELRLAEPDLDAGAHDAGGSDEHDR